MTKQEFYRSLSKEQKEYVDFLVDNAFIKGMNEGKMEEFAKQYYERY